jgi:hypothetical protein
MSYILHLQKIVKEKGKKTKVNNPCITSLKIYERGEYYPPSTLIHLEDIKEKKNLTSPHPNIWLDNVINVDSPHIVLTYSLTLHLPSFQNTQEEKKPHPVT